MKIRSIKDLIREIRKAQGDVELTDEKIAFYGGLSKGTVSQLLSGSSKDFAFRTVLKIAKALDCELEVSFKKK